MDQRQQKSTFLYSDGQFLQAQSHIVLHTIIVQQFWSGSGLFQQEVMPQLEMLKGNAITLADDMSANTRKLLVGVLSGTMQLIVRHINDCRRQQTPVILPRLGNFVQYMSSGEQQLEYVYTVKAVDQDTWK